MPRYLPRHKIPQRTRKKRIKRPLTMNEHNQIILSLIKKLKEKGYRTFHTLNYKNGKNNGEIDLIAINCKEIIVYEVKVTLSRGNIKKGEKQLRRAKKRIEIKGRLSSKAIRYVLTDGFKEIEVLSTPPCNYYKIKHEERYATV